MNTNVICWCEIYVDDIERAKTCYFDVSGTQFHDIPAVEGNGDFKGAYGFCSICLDAECSTFGLYAM